MATSRKSGRSRTPGRGSRQRAPSTPGSSTRGSSTRRAPKTVARRELLVDGGDATFRHFVHGLLAFSERLVAVREGFGQLIGLSGIQYTVLVSIAHLQEREQVSVGSVASHLHLSGAFITNVTNQLERQGLIRKSRSRNDRRRAELVTTAQADELLERLAPAQCRVNDQLFEPLSHRQFVELAAQMDALVDAGEKAVALIGYLKRSGASGSGRR